MPDGSGSGSFGSLRSHWAPDQPAEKLVDYEAEQALLAALLVRPTIVQKLPETFKSAHFADTENKLIYDVIDAHAPNGDFGVLNALGSVDPVLRDRASLIMQGMVGLDKAYVHGLCATISGLYRRRRLIAAAEQLIVHAADVNSTEVPTAISLALNDLEAIGAQVQAGRPTFTLDTAMDLALEAHDRAARGETSGIMTGFASIDAVLGGMDPGAVYIVGGRPGSGKSGLGLQMALHAAQAGHGVCFISLEMSAMQVARRAASYIAHIPQWKIKKGKCDQHDIDALMRARKELTGLPFSIEDQGGLNMQAIVLKAKAAQRKHGLKLLVVDHLHIVGTPAETTRMGATWAVEQVSKALKKLAKDFDIPVLALAQLNRGVEGRDDKRPNSSDLRQSGSIEEDAEAIMLLYRAEYYMGDKPPERTVGTTDAKYQALVSDWERARHDAAGKAELIFTKSRDSDTPTINLHFDGERTCFEELDRH